MQLYDGDKLCSVRRLRCTVHLIQVLLRARDLTHSLPLRRKYLDVPISKVTMISLLVKCSKRYKGVGDRQCVQGVAQCELGLGALVWHLESQSSGPYDGEALLVHSVQEDRW
jgi:hypothetical protein